MKKHLLYIIITAVALCGCNPDVALNSNENSPKIAEEILGMTVQEATKHLEKNGFCFGSKMEYADEYVFSKDARFTEFSYDASIMFMFGSFEDTVKYASALHRMETEKSARDLYWKWSHFAATVIRPTYSFWNGSLIVKDLSISQQPARWTTYCGGTQVEQMIKDRTDDYNNGRITKEEYDSYMETYKQTQSQFWTAYKREADNINSADEYYRNEESTGHPKEIEMRVDMNNGGRIELYYSTTRNFVVHWI